DFPSPHSLNEAISPAVERVILQALARDPEERFPHTHAFANQYLSALMGIPVPNSEVASAAKRRLVVPATPSFNDQPKTTSVPTTPPVEVGEHHVELEKTTLE